MKRDMARTLLGLPKRPLPLVRLESNPCFSRLLARRGALVQPPNPLSHSLMATADILFVLVFYPRSCGYWFRRGPCRHGGSNARQRASHAGPGQGSVCGLSAKSAGGMTCSLHLAWYLGDVLMLLVSSSSLVLTPRCVPVAACQRQQTRPYTVCW